MAQPLGDLNHRVTALEKARGETTETLRWVVARLGRIQAVQDDHTQRLDRVGARLDSIEAKVDAMPRAIAELIAASEKRVMEALPGLIVDAIRSAH